MNLPVIINQQLDYAFEKNSHTGIFNLPNECDFRPIDKKVMIIMKKAGKRYSAKIKGMKIDEIRRYNFK